MRNRNYTTGVLSLLLCLTFAQPARAAQPDTDLRLRVLANGVSVMEVSYRPYTGGPGVNGNIPADAQRPQDGPLLWFGPALYSAPVFEDVLTDDDWIALPDWLTARAREVEFQGVHFWVICPEADTLEVTLTRESDGVQIASLTAPL